MARFAETVTVTAPALHRRRHLVGRSAADRAQAGAGHHRQHRLAGDEAERRQRRRRGDVARDRAVGRRQPVRVRARPRRALQQHDAGRARCCRRPSRTRRSCRSICSRRACIDSVQVSKSYSPDRSAEFAGGLVQIVPLKLPSQPVVDFSYGFSYYSTATGKSIPLSPLGSRDCAGASTTARARCRRAFPTTRSCGRASTRRTSATRRTQITAFGTLARATSGGRSTTTARRARTGARRSATASASSASSPA